MQPPIATLALFSRLLVLLSLIYTSHGQRVEPGICPKFEPPAECPDESFNECDNDDGCPVGKKCCSTGCDLECVPPVRPITVSMSGPRLETDITACNDLIMRSNEIWKVSRVNKYYICKIDDVKPCHKEFRS